MILFIAPNPFKIKEREGYLQRVAAIDNLFTEHKKLYSDDYTSNEELAKIICKADLIYVHSIYRAEEIIDCYPVFGYKIITDLHGVVPEEELLVGEKRRSEELSRVERVVFDNGMAFVAVTNAMINHYRKKYQLSDNVKWANLPIFENNISQKKIKDTNNVVYAGGSQKWQNIKLIVDAINETGTSYKYDILTHNPEAFMDIKSEAMKNVSISTVASDKVNQHYERAVLGFILRDDVTVNNVACPTKLIEYLNNGVVPVVISPNIGDFKVLGYKYLSYDEFVSKKYSDEVLRDYAEYNYTIIDKLKQQTIEGKQTLLSIGTNIIKKHNSNSYPLSLVESAINNSQNTKDLNAARYQISEQIRMINEYADAMNHYKQKLEKIHSAKAFKIFKSLQSLKSFLKDEK